MLQANTAYAGPLIQLNAADNVLIAREGLSLGQTLSVGGVTVRLRATDLDAVRSATYLRGCTASRARPAVGRAGHTLRFYDSSAV